MLLITIFLVSLACTSFSSKIWHKLNVLEDRLDDGLNRTETEIAEIKELINRLNASELQKCETHSEEQTSSFDDIVERKEFGQGRFKQRGNIDPNIKHVYDHVERNSYALMDEFQKTMGVLRRKQENINKKIDINKESIKKAYDLVENIKISKEELTKTNDNKIEKFENKLSVIDDAVDDLKKDIRNERDSAVVFLGTISKLEKKTEDASESIANNILNVANIDLRLVEMDRRYFEFMNDFEKFKENMEQEIEGLKGTFQISPVSLKSTKKTCPISWIQHNVTCYLYDKETGYDWTTALNTCKSLGAKLAEPDSTQEMDFLRGFVHGWIGATDRDTEGIFVWESSQKPVENVPWWPGMPDNHGGDQNCLTLWGSKANDEKCSKRYRFVCEKPLE